MNDGRPPAGPVDHPDDRGFRSYGPAAVALMTVSLATWPIAFNLGAYRAVFYDDVFRVVVVSSVGFVITVIRPTYRPTTLWIVRTALAAPLAWMTLAVVLFGSLGAAVANPVYGLLGLAVAVVAIPTVLRLLIDMFARDLTTVRDAKTLAAGIAVVAAVAVLGFVAGRNNHVLLTCDDFKIAGADQPANCAPE